MEHINSTQHTNHFLIFEPLEGGHRMEFIKHLLNYIATHSQNHCRYTFTLSRKMGSNSEIVQLADKAGVAICKISDQESDRVARAMGPLGGFTHWRILKTYLSEFQPDHLLVTDITKLELPLCFHRPSCRFSALLFVQYPELHRGVKFWMKDIKTRLFLCRSKPSRIFLLNGAYSCEFLNKRFSVDCFKPVPDPVSNLIADPEFSLRDYYSIEPDRKIFLFFGSISARKGVENLVDAIERLSPEAIAKAAFVFCGVPEPHYVSTYHQLISNLREKCAKVHLYIEESFVSYTRMRAFFEQADWVVMPYTRPEYSSGILGHAAVAKTPVIGSAKGLVGRQINQYKLGLALSDSKSLHAVIEKAVSYEFDYDENARCAFIKASNPEAFASTILNFKT